MSGGDVRDEEIVNCPVVSGSDPTGCGGSLGADGAGGVLGGVGCTGGHAGVGGRGGHGAGAAGVVNVLGRLSLWMQDVGAGVDDIDEALLAEFVAAELARDLPCASVKR